MDARPRPTSAAELPVGRPPRILVIDDDRHVRMLLCDLLSAWGYEADVAADGAAGLALFDRGSYDAVLSDLAMEHVSGLDVAAGVRDRDRSVGVILFTAFMGELDGEDERLGVTVLRKPLDIEGLHRALRDAVAGSTAS